MSDAATGRDCTCTGSCKGADGLAPGWRCALGGAASGACVSCGLVTDELTSGRCGDCHQLAVEGGYADKPAMPPIAIPFGKPPGGS